MNSTSAGLLFMAAAACPSVLAQSEADTLIVCDPSAAEFSGSTCYLYHIDEWTLRKPWDHFGEPAAAVMSKDPVLLGPKERFKMTDSMYVVLGEIGFSRIPEDPNCMNRALDRSGYDRFAVKPPGERTQQKKRWAMNGWPIHGFEWSKVRFFTARASVAYLRELLPLTMECLDTGDLRYLNIAVALPLLPR